MKIIYAFRHGQTDWNKEGRIQGHLDVPLNETGREQARRLGRVLREYEVHAFLTSDLSRARETAEIAAHEAGFEVEVVADPRLREIHLGSLQGLTRAEIEARHGVEFSERLRSKPLDDADVATIGSESGRIVFERASEAILEFLARHPHTAIGVSTHGGVLRRLVQYAVGAEGFPSAPIPNAIVYPFTASGFGGSTPLQFAIQNQMRIRSSSAKNVSTSEA